MPWSRGSARSKTSSVSSKRQRASASRSRSISPIRPRPIIPYVTEHPEWFRRRPDGTIKYAENPPKKYQDIYPINFESEDWQALWRELKRVIEFWIAHGVKIFRVDNPHTKPFRFWEWALADIKQRHPDTIFLSEAFTRPKVMRYLAKCGFSQSYTYFTWRNSKDELMEYFTELTQHRRPRIHAAQSVREHAGHPARVPAARRTSGLSAAVHPRRDAGRQLRHLQRLRAGGERAGEAGQRGVPRLREVPDPRFAASISRTASRS